MERTHYQVLGVGRDASSVEIAAAFRERSAQFKDRTYAGVDTIDNVSEAYRVLSNLATRAGYDETLSRERDPTAARKGVPGWIKWALPFVLVAAALAWMKWSQPREAVMTVKSITRIEQPVEDPTAAAPVVIPPPAPLDAPAAAPVAPVGTGPISMREMGTITGSARTSISRCRPTGSSRCRRARGRALRPPRRAKASTFPTGEPQTHREC